MAKKLEGRFKLGVFFKSALAIAVSLLMFAQPVLAASLQDLDVQRKRVEEELRKLREEAKESQTTISSLDQAIRYLDRSIQNLEFQINDTERKITEAEASIKEKSIELSEQRDVLNESLRIYYELEVSGSVFLSLLEDENLSDAVSKAEYLDALQENIEQGIDTITALKTELEEKREALTIFKAEKEDQQQQLAGQRAQKDRLRDNEAAELTVLNKQIAAERALLARIESQIAAEIAKLYRQRISGVLVGTGRRVSTGTILGGVGSTGYSTGPHLHFETIRNGTPVNPRQYVPGSYPWPLTPGTFIVTQEFGRPNWNAAYSWHTGIDLAAPRGTPVKSVCSGEVILSRWYGGYGNAVVIDCGRGLWTLYAHMN